ncbi:MAG TPA: 3-phosphoshikimate 1-carboxyvinyltransferase [Candidatus Alistipes merdipullorum]|nr:3-phosphoshikimate 1-carboxyvinyltransferase [Candidatus Alistipes merdipullorum]
MDKTVSLGSVNGTITPPSSKSYAQRAIALALLAEGRTTLRNIEFCKDTRSAISCIEALGAKVSYLDESTIAVDGGLHPVTDTLMVGESGLATRLFTPIASLNSTPICIKGEGTLLHRPMMMMIEPLRRLGVEVRDGGGHLPIEVKGPIHGGNIEVDGSFSSQFITGLLLALPLAKEDTTLHVRSAVSTPYIDMTIDTAKRFGVEIMHHEGDYSEFYIEGGQKYTPADLAIEGDWSGASTMLVAGAISGRVTVKNLSTLSKQADTAICRALERAGAGIIIEGDSITVTKRRLRSFTFDATNSPDLFPALAALAAAAHGQSTIIGTQRLLHKESDRAETIRQEYEKLGIEVDISEENVMKIRGGEIHPATVFSHNDHRIAMSLAVSALRCKGDVTIENAECVEKSYPTFFEDLESITVR